LTATIREPRLNACDVVLRVLHDSLVGDWFSGSREAFVKVGEDLGPRGIVAASGLFIGKTGVSETQLRPSFVGIEFDGDDGFYSTSGSREPGQFDETIAFEAKEPAIVGMALTFELGLEEEGGVHFGFHQDGAWNGEPAVELCGPCAEESGGGRGHSALAG
jgi:hypothetical protein